MTKELEADPAGDSSMTLEGDDFLALLNEASSAADLLALKATIARVKRVVTSGLNGALDRVNIEDAVYLRRDVLASELEQILESRTIERARYYLKRLERGVKRVKTSSINDINLHRWKEYSDILTDSLWVLPRRDDAGAHLGWYWGNFVPQIPHQLMLRYTKKGDWVLDPFLGSGTTLIECKRLGRNGIGVELNRETARKAGLLISRESDRHSIEARVIVGDSRRINLKRALRERTGQVQLIIMHPPYHNIIRFSEDPEDLSNAGGIENFLQMFREVLDNISPFLERRRYLALVIGDKFEKGEWVPLGFHCMSEVLKREYSLKSIIVKNFDETRAKREQKQLWRYRALVGGFYLFKHEYILLFRKR